MENYKLNVKEENPCKLLLDFEVPQDTVNSELEKVYSELHKAAKIPGFRAGKVPLETVKAKFSELAREKVIENILRNTIVAGLKEKNIDPLGVPKVDKMDFDFGKPFKFNVIVEQHYKIKAKNYKGLKVRKEIKKVDDEDVKKTISELQRYNTKLMESKDGTVEKKHCIIAAYSVWIKNGIELPELKAENQLIDLESEFLLPGVTAGVIGLKKGEEKDIDSKIPENFMKKEFSGKEITVKLKVLSIKDKLAPNLDDEFAKDLGSESFEDLKKKIRQSLEAENMKVADEKMEKEIVDKLIAENKIAFLPETLLEEQKEHLLHDLEEKYRRQGIPKEYIEKQKETFLKKCGEEAEQQVKLMYIFNSIAEQENIAVTQEDIAQTKEEVKKANPGKEKGIEEQFMNKEVLFRLTSRLKTDKIFKFIIENTKIKTVEI